MTICTTEGLGMYHRLGCIAVDWMSEVLGSVIDQPHEVDLLDDLVEVPAPHVPTAAALHLT
jgi:hypothetical protein